jgi:hypothetical protein
MAGTISRRSAMGLLGAGGLAGALATSSVRAAGEGDAAARTADALPLHAGQRFGRWTITAVHPLQDGALDVTAKGADEHEFVLQVLARDASPLALQPPGVTESLAIFVHNSGDGWQPTDEEQGLAAMTLAHQLQASGHGGPIAGLLTHAEHIVRHRAALAGTDGGGARPSRAS